ncbi:hypothetical protein [Burkholderia sp. Bp8963]|uniref:hypothetical protein n=1 Tax=Burkholderia sp. Bp8963 TaxID=2184547 RepID=UPI000F5A7997|nr:hypothetical protein [Burkholderia sp. Bp8963]
MVKITDPRVAVAISIAALAGTAWQAYEGNVANKFNQEALNIEVAPNDIPLKRVDKVLCFNGPAAVYLSWQVTVFNASTQPVTIKDIFSRSQSPSGTASGLLPLSLKDGPVGQQFPAVIEAKNFKKFTLSVPELTSPAFDSWFRIHGGCTGQVDWAGAQDRHGFFDTGWPSPRAVSAYFTVTTGEGNVFNAISTW